MGKKSKPAIRAETNRDELERDELERAILERFTVPLWPHTGQALGISRGSTYEGARNGEIPTIAIGNRRPVPTDWLRQVLRIKRTA
jgi:hypothetical protein